MDAVAIAVAAVSAAVIVVMLVAALSLRSTARDLRLLVEEMTDHASAVIGAAEETINRAQDELARVDDLIGSAEAITETVGTASRLAHATLATPLIKLLAFGAGTARAGRRLRGGGRAGTLDVVAHDTGQPGRGAAVPSRARRQALRKVG
ncbi:MAG TPA: hypothetical protein VFN68_03455 [Acidimicrobiales bacterium]|nr:hypothetical protein [Acidimicrobiales bacterium]